MSPTEFLHQHVIKYNVDIKLSAHVVSSVERLEAK